jgi:hypothetical protein
VYRLVNRALRTGDPDLIHPYRFFINDLYSELLSIHRQYIEPDEEDFIVYRGQGLTTPELLSLQNSVGQLVTFASFISTTVDHQLAIGYALTAARQNVVSALFEFHLNATYDNTRPYAYIATQSAIPDECEVLLSVGTIFQLKSVDHNLESGLWTIVVHLCQQHSHDIKHMMRRKSGRHATKPVQFCPSSSLDEPTFHETLKLNLLSNDRNPDSTKSASLPIGLHSQSERRSSNEIHRLSLPLMMSSNQLTLHEMNWGEKPSDCGFLEVMNEKPFSLSNALSSLFQDLPERHSSMSDVSSDSVFCFSNTKRPSLPNLSHIQFSKAQSKSTMLKMKIETNPHKSEQSLEDPLFEAGIIDALVFGMERAYTGFKDSMSLKEETQVIRRYLKHDFNFNQGRWCDEY